MKLKFTIPMMVLLLGFALQMIGQRAIKGTVTSSDGDPLIGASIMVKGTSTGVISDLDGKYEIKAKDGDYLVFSYIGFNKQEVKVDGQSTIDVVMNEGVSLNEVVVTALGISREKKSLGYAVSDMSGDEIIESRQSQVLTGMQGKVPGVIINQTSGAPGAGADIVIRGITSLDPSRSNSPLIVVDGVPISNSTDVGNMLPKEKSAVGTNNGQSSFSNRLMDINPSDVENISILKGASATALYGIRASNGVVLITTKKGISGKPVITYNTSYGWDKLGKRPKYQFKYGMGRSGRLIPGNKYEYWYTLGPPVTDQTKIYDPINDFFQTGSRFENSIGVRGGNDLATYYTSFSNRNQSGIVPASDWKRYTGRIGGNIKATDKLTISGGVNFVKSGGARPFEGDKSVLSSLAYFTTGVDINDYINDDGSMKDLTNGTIDNPRYLAEFTRYFDNVNRTYGNLGFNYKHNDFFSIEYKFGLDHYSDFRKRIIPPGFDLSSKNHGFVIAETVGSREYNSLLMFKLNKKITNTLSAHLTLGNDVLDRKKDVVNSRGEDYELDNFNSINNTKNKFIKTYGSRNRILGFFGLLSLSYNDFLYLDITGRNDISSTLPKNNRSYFYPSVSLAWVLSDMVSLPKVFSFTKLRASYAQVGKDALPHRIGAYYNPGSNFPFGDILGYGQSSVYGDPNLKPEFTKTIELGGDFRFFNNRLGVDFTWYKSTSEDLITSVPVSNTTGKSRFVTNAGSIENSGIEVALNTTPIKTNSFSWNFDVNYSTTNSKVLEIADGIESIEYYGGGYTGIIQKLVPGGSIGDFYGRKYARAPNGELLINKDGFPERVDTYSLAGNAIPDFIMGFNNTFTIGNFSLSAVLEWRKGGDVVDLGWRNSARNGLLEETSIRYAQVIFKGVVEDENGKYVKNTKEVELYPGGFYRWSDRFNRAAENLIQDGSWIRLRNVSLAYMLPKKIINNIGFISDAKISFSGSNLFLNTPFRGYDPETNFFGSGSNIRGYTGLKTPGTKSYTLSLDLTF